MAVYDAIVVGGGVVGAAIARELQCSGKSVLLCEKEKEWLSGASSGNTGHLGSNFYYTPGRGAPLEAQLTARAREINAGWLGEQPHVPARKDGMVYIARGKEEDQIIEELLSLAAVNRVETVRRLTREELELLEPDMECSTVTSALYSEEEWIVDSWSLSMTHVHGCCVSGVDMRLECEVLSVHRDQPTGPGSWRVETSQGSFLGELVINCGGNFADQIETLKDTKSDVSFKIRPRKGEYIVLQGDSLVRRPVVPVPTKQTAGVYVFRSISGHTVVGPTNVLQDSRTELSVSSACRTRLKEYLVSVYPGTATQELVGVYAGLRPATQHQDYIIQVDLPQGWVTVAGIRSTGLTCSLAISQYVCDKIVENYSPAKVPQLPPPQLEGERVRFGDKTYLPTHPLAALYFKGHLGDQSCFE